MRSVALRIVNDVSYETRTQDETPFTWQAQHLVRLEGDACCSALVNDVAYVTTINYVHHFSWQAQYLVMLECHFSWQAQYSVKFE